MAKVNSAQNTSEKPAAIKKPAIAMVKIVYFGKKSPKIVEAVSPEKYKAAMSDLLKKVRLSPGEPVPVIIKYAGDSLKYVFEPFRALDVVAEVGKILVANAGDCFKLVDRSITKEKPDHNPSGNGYVGDGVASDYPDLKKKIDSQTKEEKGKSMKQLEAEITGRKASKEDLEKEATDENAG